MSMLRRAFLGPAIPATCSNCGNKIGVPWGKSFLALAPSLMALLVSQLSSSRGLSIAILSVGVVVTIVVSSMYVPLIKT